MKNFVSSKKLLAFFMSFAVFLVVGLQAAFAQTSSPSPTASPTASPQATPAGAPQTGFGAAR